MVWHGNHKPRRPFDGVHTALPHPLTQWTADCILGLITVQSRSGPENVHSGAEKRNKSKRNLQQRWGREVQTRLHEGTQSDTNFIQRLIFIQKSVRKTRQLTFFLG